MIHITKLCELNDFNFEYFKIISKDNYKLYVKDYLERLHENDWQIETKFAHFRQIKHTSNHDKFTQYVNHTYSMRKQTIIIKLWSENNFVNSFISE